MSDTETNKTPEQIQAEDLRKLSDLYADYISTKAATSAAVGDEAKRLLVKKLDLVVAVSAIKSKYGLP